MKTIFFVALALLATYGSIIALDSSTHFFKWQCQPHTHQFNTEQLGCIKSCSDPRFKNCPTKYPNVNLMRYCGLGKDGIWRNYTFECQACLNSTDSTNLGVVKGTCPTNINDGPKCTANTDCAALNSCVNGNCIEDPIEPTPTDCGGTCTATQICVNNLCVAVVPTPSDNTTTLPVTNSTTSGNTTTLPNTNTTTSGNSTSVNTTESSNTTTNTPNYNDALILLTDKLCVNDSQCYTPSQEVCYYGRCAVIVW